MTDTKHTGWQNGLSQDYCPKLHLWFATRLDARAVIRRFWGKR